MRNKERIRIKVIYNKKEMWKKLVTTARFALCQHCTNNSLYNRLDQAQSEDQRVFRRSDQTLDHFATYRLLEQKCWEWDVKMWVATVDYF